MAMRETSPMGEERSMMGKISLWKWYKQ